MCNTLIKYDNFKKKKKSLFLFARPGNNRSVTIIYALL